MFIDFDTRHTHENWSCRSPKNEITRIEMVSLVFLLQVTCVKRWIMVH